MVRSSLSHVREQANPCGTLTPGPRRTLRRRWDSALARRLGIPKRTWCNYESGATVPAEILLQFLEVTSVEPNWLLYGSGPRYRGGERARQLSQVRAPRLGGIPPWPAWPDAPGGPEPPSPRQ